MPAVDWKAAIRYAQLVNIAYSVAPAAPYTPGAIAAITQAGFTFVEALYGNELATDISPHSGETVTYGFLATSAAGELIAAIRGTETIEEWLHDFAFLFVPNPIHAGGGLTEDGFTAIYRSLRAGADPNTPTAIAAITNLVSTSGASSITVTGHSLGAALATLLALDAGLNSGIGSSGTTVYTFASPRTGDHFFAGSFNATIPESYRIYNRTDLVPQLPPILPLPYEHTNTPFELVAPMGAIQNNLACAHDLKTYLWLMGQQVGANPYSAAAACLGSSYPGPPIPG